MAPLTQDRDTRTADIGQFVDGIPIAAGATIYAGSLVCIDNAGRAVAGTDAANRTFGGIAMRRYVSTGADSFQVEVKTGCNAYLANSAAQPCTDALRGSICYLEDDQTVAILTTNWIPVGIIRDVDAGGVWVGLATPEQLLTAVAGSFAVGGNLAVAGTSGLVGITTCTGRLNANGGIDRTAAAALNLGVTTATSIEIGRAGINTNVNGALVVDQASTFTGAAGFTALATFTQGPRIQYAAVTTGGAPTQAEMVAAFGAGVNGQIGVIWDDTPGAAYICAFGGGAWYYALMTVGA